jgi:hypothetical protein
MTTKGVWSLARSVATEVDVGEKGRPQGVRRRFVWKRRPVLDRQSPHAFSSTSPDHIIRPIRHHRNLPHPFSCQSPSASTSRSSPLAPFPRLSMTGSYPIPPIPGTLVTGEQAYHLKEHVANLCHMRSSRSVWSLPPMPLLVPKVLAALLREGLLWGERHTYGSMCVCV